MNRFGKLAVAALLGSTALGTAVRADGDDNHHRAIKHVLLISVDGMHEVDLQRYVNGHPTSAFAKLLRHGVHYTNAHTSQPVGFLSRTAGVHDRRLAEDARRIL